MRSRFRFAYKVYSWGTFGAITDLFLDPYSPPLRNVKYQKYVESLQHDDFGRVALLLDLRLAS